MADDPTGDRIDLFTAGKAIPVEVGAIERELSRLWREASARAVASLPHDGAPADIASGETRARLAVARACLWNLVICAEDAADVALVKGLVDALSSILPARVLVLAPRPDEAAPRLRAWVEANYRVGKEGTREICSEEVTLEADGASTEHLPSLVRELLVPDVPAALYWRGDPPDESRPLAAVLPSIDRLVLDTDRVWDTSVLGGLVQLLRAHPELEICDLGWMRLAPLRARIAALFDPPNVSYLAEVTSIRIECLRHREPAALLLLGWIAGQLRLGMARAVPPHRGELAWVLGRQRPPAGTAGEPGRGREIAAHLVPLDHGDDLGGIASVTFKTPTESVIVRVLDGAVTLQAIAQGHAASEKIEPRADLDLLTSALGSRGCDPLYPRTLSRAAEIAAAVQSHTLGRGMPQEP